MTKDEAMKLAQEVCPYFDEISKGAFYEGFITALDHLPDATKMMGLIPSEWAGLEEPPNSTTDVVEPEPVAWCEINSIGEIMYFDGRAMIMPGKFGNDLHTVPLYAAPPKRKWQGLTDEEINQAANNAGFGHINIAREIEAKLKEKNHD